MKKLHNPAEVHCYGLFHIIEVNLGEVINLIFLIEKSERFIMMVSRNYEDTSGLVFYPIICQAAQAQALYLVPVCWTKRCVEVMR